VQEAGPPEWQIALSVLRPVKPGSGVMGKLARRGRLPVGYYNDPEKTAKTFLTIDGQRWVIPGDLASGQLYALKVVNDPGDGTGQAVWVALDRAAVQINADAEATRVGATGYFRPEDVEISTSTGNSRGQVLYVAVTGNSGAVREPTVAAAPRSLPCDDGDDQDA